MNNFVKGFLIALVLGILMWIGIGGCIYYGIKHWNG